MNCPQCGAEKLLTTETFQLPYETVRTKKCRECHWSFTSHERIAEDHTIPKAIRDIKSKRVIKHALKSNI